MLERTLASSCCPGERSTSWTTAGATPGSVLFAVVLSRLLRHSGHSPPELPQEHLRKISAPGALPLAKAEDAFSSILLDFDCNTCAILTDVGSSTEGKRLN